MNHLIIDTETTGVTTNSTKPTKNNPDGLSMKPGEPYAFTQGHSQPYMIGLVLYDEQWNEISEARYEFAPASVREVMQHEGLEPTEEGIRATMDKNIDFYHKMHLVDKDGKIHMENIDRPQPFELGAAEVSGTNPEEVYAMDEIDWPAFKDKLDEMAENADITAYNADFDVKMLCYEAALKGDDISSRFFDAEGHKTYNDAQQIAMDKIGLDRSLRLEELVHSIRNEKYERNPEAGRQWYTQSHDALADVKDTAECLQAMEEGIIPSKDIVIRSLKALSKSGYKELAQMRENAEELTGDDKIKQLYLANEKAQRLRFKLGTKIDHFAGTEPKLVKTEIEDPGYNGKDEENPHKRELSYIEVFGINGDGNSFRFNSKDGTMTPDNFGAKDPEGLGGIIAKGADIKGVTYQQAKSGYMRLIKNTLAAPHRSIKKADKILKPVWDMGKFITPEALKTVEDYGTDEWGQKMPNTYLKAACEVNEGKKPASYAFDAVRMVLDDDKEISQKLEESYAKSGAELSDAQKEGALKEAKAMAEKGADPKQALDAALEKRGIVTESHDKREKAAAKGEKSAAAFLEKAGKEVTEEDRKALHEAMMFGMKPEQAASYVRGEAVEQTEAKETKEVKEETVEEDAKTETAEEETEEEVQEESAEEEKTPEEREEEENKRNAEMQMENFGRIYMDEYGNPRDDIERIADELSEGMDPDYDNYTVDVLTAKMDGRDYICVADDMEAHAVLMAEGKVVAESNERNGMEPILDYLKKADEITFDDDEYRRNATLLKPEIAKASYHRECEQALKSFGDSRPKDVDRYIDYFARTQYIGDNDGPSYETYQDMLKVEDALKRTGCKSSIGEVRIAAERCHDSINEMTPEQLAGSVGFASYEDGTPTTHLRDDTKENFRIYMAANKIKPDMTGKDIVEMTRHRYGEFRESDYPASEVKEAGGFGAYVASGKAKENDARMAERLDRDLQREKDSHETVEMNVTAYRGIFSSCYVVSDDRISEGCEVNTEEHNVLSNNLEISPGYDAPMDVPPESAGTVKVPKELYNRIDAGERKRKLDELEDTLWQKMQGIQDSMERGELPSAEELSECSSMRAEMKPYEDKVRDSDKARRELLSLAEPAMLEHEKGALKEKVLGDISNLKKSLDRCQNLLKELAKSGVDITDDRAEKI